MNGHANLTPYNRTYMYPVQNACMQGGISWTTRQTIVSDTNKIHSRDVFMFLP